MVVPVRLIAWMSEARLRALTGLLPDVKVQSVDSASALRTAAREKQAIAVVDDAALRTLPESPGCPVIALTDEHLPGAVNQLASHPWLDHVLGASTLANPLTGNHLGHVVRSLAMQEAPRLLDWVEEDTINGRRVRLVQASRRTERLDKITEFFEDNGVGSRMVQVLRDSAEELLTNAFYDAPVAAGVVSEPISRTRDVCLPDEHACDLAYGCRDDVAFVRVRDPFGSLPRARLVDVLARCARTDMQVEVDETMGGAGLGLWRIFSGATVVGISVVGGRSTEILVAMWKRSGAAGARPFGYHLFFDEGKGPRRGWAVDPDSTITTAVTLVEKTLA